MPLADMSIPTYADFYRQFGPEDRALSNVALLLLFASVVLLETAVLTRVSKQTSLTALRDSLVANAVSTLAGVCLIAAGVLVRGQTNAVQSLAMFPGTLLLETPVLMLIHHRAPKAAVWALVMSAKMNVASYLFMGALLLGGLLVLQLRA